ncbi:MAG: GNAT family N-acetyltransferase, partial [Christensenellaceae bacterium]|nr:GNAT family N-acetyltransferase [Christensenellaceae bacterium]
THRSVADSKGFIRGILHKYRVGDPASWAIALKEDGRVIGTIGFMWVNHENASAEVGYSIGVEHWNKGYMTEALQAVIDHGFGEMRLNRIEAQHDVENPASGRVMAKCGMRPEGTLRQRLYNKGKFIDVAIYSILRQEWRERQSPLR